jgi:hypothetical protein
MVDIPRIIGKCAAAVDLCVLLLLTSTTRANGAHSYSSLSFAGADVDTGLQKTPPPCSSRHAAAEMTVDK